MLVRIEEAGTPVIASGSCDKLRTAIALHDCQDAFFNSYVSDYEKEKEMCLALRNLSET